MKAERQKNNQHKEEWILYGVSLGLVFGLLGFLYASDLGYLVIGMLIGISMGLLFTYLNQENNEQESQND